MQAKNTTAVQAPTLAKPLDPAQATDLPGKALKRDFWDIVINKTPSDAQIAVLESNGPNCQAPSHTRHIRIPTTTISIPEPQKPPTPRPCFCVNARQYTWILKRRAQREQLSLSTNRVQKKRYMHESQHKHADRRPRNRRGGFLNKTAGTMLSENGRGKLATMSNDGAPGSLGHPTASEPPKSSSRSVLKALRDKPAF
ncbi:MAG: Transcriptional activator [Icmadophila ericetorum]|nr:Transcriptional activator [Icmadophila ericetorum]